MSDYCNCCSNNVEWLETHHFYSLEDIMDSDPKEIAEEIYEISTEELDEDVPDLDKLMVMIEDIQYIFQPSTVKRVSIHEAGHAVLDYHYGNKINFIQVGCELDTAGCVKSTKKSDFEKKLKETDPTKYHDLFWAEINKYCHIMLGGVAALHIYDGKRKILPTLGAKIDIDNCRKFLKAVVKNSFTEENIYSVFFDGTVKILEEKWKAVEALTEVLENKWSDNGAFIEGEEVERIIERSIEATA
jgi:hypothetical protein